MHDRPGIRRIKELARAGEIDEVWAWSWWMLPECPNRKSHPAVVLKHDAALLFEESVSQETLLELYDRAIEQQNGSGNESRISQRRAALSEKLSTLAAMRDKFQRQEAEDLMTLDELRERLAEIEEEKVRLTAELRAVEDEAAASRRIEAARESISNYSPVHGEWYEDPDAVMPGRCSPTPQVLRTDAAPTGATALASRSTAKGSSR